MTAKRPPWYPHNIEDYDRDTFGLSFAEHGAYRRLLDAYYRTGAPLPVDRKQLLRICGAANPVEGRLAVTILDRFFVRDNNLWRHKRCDAEIARMAAISQKRAVAGAKGGSKPEAIAQAKAPHIVHSSSSKEELEESIPTGSSTKEVDLLGHDVSKPNGKTNGAAIKRQAEFPTEDDLAEAVEHWNIKAAQFGLPQIEKLTGKRRSHLRARLRELGDLGGWFGTINGMIDMPFLLGKVKDWKADFDWVINESNFRKIDEGKYRR